MVDPRAPRRDDESGFGLIEVVIAMFLLAIVALAMIPAFANAMQLSTQNVLVGRAAAIVNQQIDLAILQAKQSPSCSAIAGLETTAPQPASGSSGADFAVSRTVSDCPTSLPGLMTVSVSVSRATGGQQLASASTTVAVVSAS